MYCGHEFSRNRPHISSSLVGIMFDVARYSLNSDDVDRLIPLGACLSLQSHNKKATNNQQNSFHASVLLKGKHPSKKCDVISECSLMRWIDGLLVSCGQ